MTPFLLNKIVSVILTNTIYYRTTISEAREMLDKRLEILGTLYDKQYKLLKGVLESDNKKLKKINDKEIDDDQIIDLLVSKFVKKIIFDNF